MANSLRIKGAPTGFLERTLGRVTFKPVGAAERADCFLAITRENNLPANLDPTGYLGLLTETGVKFRLPRNVKVPISREYDTLTHISTDSVLAIDPDTGQTYVLYRPESPNNAIFATGQCNSNCLMCSQPPVVAGNGEIVNEHLRLIELIKDPPNSIGITGGEPTLLKDGLITILFRLKERFPDTHVQMLTNGRLYAYHDLVAKISAVGHPHFLSAIPLYSDVASEHDYVVQARGAFDETVVGLYNAARQGLRVEIRVVLHKQTLPRLRKLVEFIYSNLPFVEHVALMGLENMGYVKKNWNLLWVDPLDYSDVLEDAVRYLFYRRMNVSIYNLQLCVLPRSLWPFSRHSISDYKNIFLDECLACSARAHCGGLFKSSEQRHSRGIKAITVEQMAHPFLEGAACPLSSQNPVNC
jgi:His-Xaa-Ser system radical SAM maturase HxsC